MGTVDLALMKAQIWDYIDGDAIKELVGKAGDAQWSPFRLDPVTGKPVGFQEGVINNTAFLLPLVEAASHVIEKITYDAKGVATGTDKKKALIDWINSLIDIPVIPNWLEDNAIAWLLDLVIGKLNLLFGHKWFDHVPTPPALVKKSPK